MMSKVCPTNQSTELVNTSDLLACRKLKLRVYENGVSRHELMHLFEFADGSLVLRNASSNRYIQVSGGVRQMLLQPKPGALESIMHSLHLPVFHK